VFPPFKYPSNFSFWLAWLAPDQTAPACLGSWKTWGGVKVEDHEYRDRQHDDEVLACVHKDGKSTSTGSENYSSKRSLVEVQSILKDKAFKCLQKETTRPLDINQIPHIQEPLDKHCSLPQQQANPIHTNRIWSNQKEKPVRAYSPER